MNHVCHLKWNQTMIIEHQQCESQHTKGMLQCKDFSTSIQRVSHYQLFRRFLTLMMMMMITKTIIKAEILNDLTLQPMKVQGQIMENDLSPQQSSNMWICGQVIMRVQRTENSVPLKVNIMQWQLQCSAYIFFHQILNKGQSETCTCVSENKM